MQMRVAGDVCKQFLADNTFIKGWKCLCPNMFQDIEDEVFEFFAVSEKPVIIKKAVPDYPDLARKAQIEGKVVVTVTIDKKGNVERANIFKSVPMLDDAAIAAAMKCKFKPAKQRDKFVKVKMNIPFQFKLK